MLQHGAYTLLTDACYDRERFPTLEEAIEWLWASTTDEEEAVKFVISKFFTLEDGVYVQKRIQDELDKYHENAATNKRIAIEREAKRKGNGTKRAPVVNEPSPNQEPRTKNQEPRTNKPVTKKEIQIDFVDQEMLFEQFWNAGMVKTGKKKCWPIFKKLVSKEKGQDWWTGMLIADIKQRLSSGQLGFDSMHPSTYLNGERWEDAAVISSQAPQTQTREQKTAQANRDLLAHYKQKDQIIEGELNEQFKPNRLN